MTLDKIDSITRYDLYKKAKKTIKLLNDGIFELKIIEYILSAYEDACEIWLAKLDIEPRKFNAEDLKRILFEILCFASFDIMSRFSSVGNV